MPLKTEVLKAWPTGGWQFYQPETNWEAPAPKQYTYEQQIQNIIKMRQANPRFNLSTDPAVVGAELEAYTCKRLNFDPKYCTGVEDKKKALPFNLRPKSVLGAAAAAVGIDTSVLEDWFGAGAKPVEQALAEGRASVCAVCPENSASPNCVAQRRNSWRDWLTAPMASGLRKLLEHRNQMNLATPQDDLLGKCLACKCELKLKVFVPIGHIIENTDPEDLKKLHPSCWVLAEK